jgi:hypothetical protein
MHKNYYELQKRCKRYYLKIYLRYLLIGILVAVMAASVAIYFQNEQNVQNEQIQTKSPQSKSAVSQPKPKEEQKQETTSNDTQNESEKLPDAPLGTTIESNDSNQTTAQLEKQKKELTPVYNFEIEALYQQQLQKAKEATQSAQATQIKQEQKQSPAPTKTPIRQKPSNNVTIQSITLQNVEDKIKLFNERPHFEHAYTIAKDYFDKKEYANAIKWCKEADALKSAQEKVFELYALSLVKMQRYNEAVSLLNYYLSMKVSNKLESLKYAIEQKKL